MRKYIYAAIALIVILLSSTTFTFYKMYEEADRQYKRTMVNYKAYENLMNDSLKKHMSASELTISELKYSNDSVNQRIVDIVDSMNIKLKKVNSIHYKKSYITKRDTVVMPDTIFVIPGFLVDTTLGDAWVATRLRLEYPSRIDLSSIINLETTVVAHVKRETVEPPHKFFLFRWFQKKHNVIYIDTDEKNPYVKNKENRYVVIDDN